jgi:hypothetical protein
LVLDEKGEVKAEKVGKRNRTSEADAAQSVPQIGWSAKWVDISSRGRLFAGKPKDRNKDGNDR